ncbi:MAG: 30S ribosomal protein S13 [Candidatus Wildermuthbacteria bacterium]|nr:30S ribosomal protein S13 [Candidatus Wildermuthbacteria bacterium]MBI2121131.1 30S ribosomal protein S13 [Candidatus Wildermuthbacteria bacterium]MBI2647963.1 30S ribosomal protein S13 [Candidatus Wildermuthbacteria bacterium]
MARIAGVQIADNKKLLFGLPYVYGIGPALAKKIIQEARLDPDKKVGDLTAGELNTLKKIMETGRKIEGDLRREIVMNIKRLKDIGSWRGMRHARRLPARGQQTRTNTRTVRGNVRKTVGSGKRPSASPT